MYTVFLTGGIASGKSTVGRMLRNLGAHRIDLDEISRSVLSPGSECLEAVVDAFGKDLLDSTTGELKRDLLAERAFVSAKTRERLEAIELPYIFSTLTAQLKALESPTPDQLPALSFSAVEAKERQLPVVVEVPNLDRMDGSGISADETVVVWAPYELRKRQAVSRGMSAEDFDRRAAEQVDEDYLLTHADTVLVNTGTLDDLAAKVQLWWDTHGFA